MPFQKGQSGNAAGRAKGATGSIKTAALRTYGVIVSALGTEVATSRIYELIEERAKTADLDELLNLAERFASPVIREMLKDNRIEISTTDELAAAIQAALLAKAANARSEDS